MLLPFCIIILSLAACSCCYYFVEKGSWAQHQVQKPWVYTLSLGGYAGTWAMLGAIELASRDGFLYLSYFFGTAAIFMFSPLLLRPLIKLSQTYHLHSLADLLSFRYNSQLVGVITTLGSTIGAIPLMSLQLIIIGQAGSYLSQGHLAHFSSHVFIFILCVGIGIYSTINIYTNNNSKARYEGLAFTTAILSIIKLVLLLIISTYCVYSVFGSFHQLELWLSSQPERLQALYETQHSNHSRSLTLIFFAAALAMPHMFLLTFNHRATPQAIKQASWGFPLFLLALSLPTLPFIWISNELGLETPSHLIPLAIGFALEETWISLAVFIAVLAAVIGSLSTICSAISSMLSSHVVLPMLLRSKRHSVIDENEPMQGSGTVIVLVLALFVSINTNDIDKLSALGFASYTALLQLLPGILAVLYWPKGNRTGLLAGLLAGFSIWIVGIVLPTTTTDAFGLLPFIERAFLYNNENYWLLAALASLGINILVFGTYSILFPANEDQRYIAKLCSHHDISQPLKRRLNIKNTQEMVNNLSKELGYQRAQEAVDKALSELNMQHDEQRPFALRLLRRQLESNFSSMFGPTVARRIVANYIPYTEQSSSDFEDQQITEFRLEQAKNNLSGLAAELDKMRRRHQKTIEQLPIGVCSFSADDKVITIWNQSLASTTGIASQEATGKTLDDLPKAWADFFNHFLQQNNLSLFKQSFNHDTNKNSQDFVFNLHKTSNQAEDDGVHTFLIEDISQLSQLEREWQHHDRLASIGRLAAGVAHEIGNPVTGIACLAQNLKYDSDNPDVDASAKDILTQTDRINKIVQSLVNFSHAGSSHHDKKRLLETVNIHNTVEDAIHLLSLNYRELADQVKNSIPDTLTINADAQELLQVFINLIENAYQAMPKSDSHHPLISVSAKQLTEQLEIYVEDNGSGIDSNIIENIFEPFVTSKHSAEGTGLGLSMVYNIIEEHHGTIHADSPINEAQQGARFTISLPSSNN